MASDVEALLADLGRSWNATVEHIDLDEVLAGQFDDATTAPARANSGSDGERNRHWPIVMLTSAALVAALVIGLALVHRDDETTPIVTIVPTTSPTPTTTVPTVAHGAGAWWPVGRLAAPCAPCGDSVRVRDGRVVIAGGLPNRAIQIYDPATATFSIAVTLPEGVVLESIVTATDGRLVLTGPLGAVAIFDPADDSLEIVRKSADGGMTGSDGERTAGQLGDGRVLLFGSKIVESLDLATGAITSAAGRSTADRVEAPDVVVPLPGGDVLVADHIAAELYDPVSGAFTPFDDGLVGVIRALPLGDGRLLLVRSNGQTTHSTEIYDPTAGTFETVGTWTPAAVLSDGRVFALEQESSLFGDVVSAAIHDLITGEVVPVALPTGRRFGFGAVPVVLDDDHVLIFGNYPGNGGAGFDADTTTAELFSFGDPELPPGCCPPNAQDISVTATQPNDWESVVGRPLRAQVTIPPGGLVGAVRRASWMGEAVVDGGSSGEVGELTLPADCERGCQFDLPWQVTPSASTTAVNARVVITFEGPPPTAAKTISMTIEPQP